MNLGVAARDVVELVKGAGIAAVLDERDLNVPGALVGPSTIDYPRMDDTTEITWDIWLVAPDNGPEHALTELGQMLDLMRARFAIDEARAATLLLPNHSADALPALHITLTLQHLEE